MIDKDAIRELIKASFSGDRSAAGRYAAEQRWKGHAKKDISKELTINSELTRKDRGTVWATDNKTGKVIGALNFDANFIGRIYVLPDYRRKGVASYLYEEAKKLNGGLEMKADDYTVSGAGFMSAVTGKEIYQTGDNSWVGIEWKSWLARLERDALNKASFSGDRSAAGRYAAEQRWKGHVKTGRKIPMPNGKAPDITKELKTYFGATQKRYEQSEGRKEVQKRHIRNHTAGQFDEDLQLEIIAEKQNFTGKPKVVSAEEMNQLEKEGWTIAYRGISDAFQEGSDISEEGTIVESRDLAQQFLEGDYFAGYGAYGNGTYCAVLKETAEGYATQGDSKGTVLKIAIPPDSLMSSEQFAEEVKKKYEKTKIAERTSDFWGDDDLGRVLSAKGFRGARIKSISSPAEIINIWDRSMLAVEELDTTK